MKLYEVSGELENILNMMGNRAYGQFNNPLHPGYHYNYVEL
jgi:hypothetical protein